MDKVVKSPGNAGGVDLHQTMDDINATMKAFIDTANVDRVYGAPVEVGETIIIPAAENLVVMGFGAGGGYGTIESESDEETPKKGEGMGEGGGGGGGGGGGQMDMFGGEKAGMEPENPAMGGEAPIQSMGDEATFEGATGESRGMGGGV